VLLDLDEFTPFFSKLKSFEKLTIHNNVWQYICQRLGWKYYAASM